MCVSGLGHSLGPSVSVRQGEGQNRGLSGVGVAGSDPAPTAPRSCAMRTRCCNWKRMNALRAAWCGMAAGAPKTCRTCPSSSPTSPTTTRATTSATCTACSSLTTTSTTPASSKRSTLRWWTKVSRAPGQPDGGTDGGSRGDGRAGSAPGQQGVEATPPAWSPAPAPTSLQPWRGHGGPVPGKC